MLPAEPRGRPRWLVPAAVVAVLVLAAAVVALVVGPGAAPDENGPAADSAARVDTVLVGLQQGDRLAAASLLAVGADQASALLVPTRLVVDVAAGGRGPLAEAAAVGPAAPGNAVADVLDVRVDGTWLLTPGALAALVDAVGGVPVDVDVDVQADAVALPAGSGQRLSGVQAAAFATHLGDDEAEAVRLARFEQVVSGVVAALPDGPAEVARLLATVEGDVSTLDEADLTEILAAASERIDEAAYGASVLPVNEIATGGEQVLYGLDDEAAAEVLRTRFAGAQRAGARESLRVLVQNGVGVPGLGDAARTRLVEAGFRFVGGGNAQSLGRERTAVLVPSGGSADRDAGVAVAEALGLPADVVAVGQEAPTTADVVVVLGADFAEAVGPAS